MLGVGIQGGVPVDLQKRGGELRPVLDKPLETVLISGIHIPLLGRDITGSKQRDESHNRADLDGNALFPQLQMVVVEAIIIIPESGPSEFIHRLNDPGEVGDELRTHVGVDRVMDGEFQRHAQHGEAVEGHP